MPGCLVSIFEAIKNGSAATTLNAEKRIGPRENHFVSCFRFHERRIGTARSLIAHGSFANELMVKLLLASAIYENYKIFMKNLF